jgi:hypothetical protein
MSTIDGIHADNSQTAEKPMLKKIPWHTVALVEAIIIVILLYFITL